MRRRRASTLSSMEVTDKPFHADALLDVVQMALR
jgi:hypothetical protein